MHKQDSQHQSGQSLIIFTLLIVAMLAFAGLIIDGGNAYATRRHAQNAADAGALAGARELATRYDCGEAGSALDDAAIARRINEYAERNGTPDSNGNAGDPTNTNVRRRYIDTNGDEINTAQDIGQVGYVPADAVGVRVIPNVQVDTFFMGLVGLNQVTIAAEADACVGLVQNVNGGAIFPVALDMDIIDPPDGSPDAQAGDVIRIWDKDVLGVERRIGAPGGGNTYEWQQCGQRGWLNLDYVFSKDDPDSRTEKKTHSNERLKYWTCNDYTHMVYAGTVNGHDGDYINGDPGTRASAIHEANCRLYQTVIVPIYDYTCSANYLQDEGFPTPDIGWVAPPGGQGAGLIYHIVGFAAVKITSLQGSGQDKYIETEFVNAVFGGNIDPNNLGDPSDLCGPKIKTVGLVR